MDVFRPRAIPALIVATCALVPAASRAACDALAGPYAYRAESGEPRRTFSDLVDVGGSGRKLFAFDSKATPAQGLGSAQPRARGKTTPLSATVVLKTAGSGMQVEFLDAKGVALATLPFQSGWRCMGNRLEKSDERLTGLGNDIRTERLEQSLSRTPGGDLLFSETITPVDPPGKATRAETKFAATARRGG